MASSATGSRLPNELTNEVIQNLDSEAAALAACALVARAWVPEAHRHLFSRLCIHENNCAQIVEYLTSSTSPNIAGHVKHLNVYLWGDLRTNVNRRSATLNPLLYLLLPHISHFTNVRELTFDGCRAFHDLQWDEVWTDLLASALPSLSHLNIEYLTFEDLPDVVDLVSAFPQLIQLSVDDIDVAEASHEYSNEDQELYDGEKTPPPMLETIRYTSGSFASGGGPFLNWLTTGPPTLTTVYLDLDAEAGDVTDGVELIGAAGPKLETLFLNFTDQWHLWEGLQFSANTHLRSMVLKSVSDYGASLVQILESISSPLEHLTLGNIDHLKKETWPSLIRVLMSPSLSLLAQVNFYLSEDSGEDLASQLSKEYPEFFGKGIAFFARKRHNEWVREANTMNI
ncbi:hypothetical protein C8R43DRAFT_998141 [Mycena crocata]|nr:hypothetical protein C8R43DRAFT_998141 [Mycena crocata]